MTPSGQDGRPYGLAGGCGSGRASDETFHLPFSLTRLSVSSLGGWLAAVECTLTSALSPLTATVLTAILGFFAAPKPVFRASSHGTPVCSSASIRLAASRLSHSSW